MGVYGVGNPAGAFYGISNYVLPDGLNTAGGVGISGAGGNGIYAGIGISGTGGNGSVAGTGVYGAGGAAGAGGCCDGPGGYFVGGNSVKNSIANGDGIVAVAGSGVAGYFSGDLEVIGNVYASSKAFKIDHPLDPADKYLVHASIESSEMKNLYDGLVTTDAQGEATVQLPDWFETLNTDFRYQLTVIGQFAQAIVASKIQNRQFRIKTNLPKVEVSWQVTGVRHDAFAKAHPMAVEEEKELRLRGYYIHPELYGAPDTQQIEWARHPQMMKLLKNRHAAPPATPAPAIRVNR